ncbi:unnamed protein product [Rotaria sordida]|uniref:PLAT domain-containing protein n=1 Tax=Rotaria sordida TaxID=392033 RepID=A0A814UIN7_9BILA|nr:unnamed protein product [Rotaria sordida]CAF3983077.1 unnamed protein product [Rotaria sordida]
MEEVDEFNLCSICNKLLASRFCIGCKKYFCLKDFKQHEQQLLIKFNNEIVRSHDEILDQIKKLEKPNYLSLDLFAQIERWKKTTINKVEKAAEKAHHELTELIGKKQISIAKEFEPITKEIRFLREQGNFVETNVDRLKQKINQVKQKLEQLLPKDTNKAIIVDNNYINWNQLIYIREERENIIPYEIEVTTSDEQNSGTTQYGWIIIEGTENRSEKFYMRNTPRNNILQDGQTNTFTFSCRPLGEIRRIILGHEERREYSLRTYKERETKWHVSHITITDPSTSTIYKFPIKRWIHINNKGDVFNYTDEQEDTVEQEYIRQAIKYKIIVHTGDVFSASTDANVSIILYGTLGHTGSRRLKKKDQKLFRRGQIDEFIITCLDLGQLNKLHIEHDDTSFTPDWFLAKVEVVNMETNETVVFPCNRWLGKKHDDHQIHRHLVPMDDS